MNRGTDGRRVATVLAAGFAAATLLLSGCASAGDTNDGGTESGPSTLKVGYLPISDSASFFVAQENDEFKANNLVLEASTFAGGSQLIPALQSGALDIGYVAVLSAMQAVEQGLDVQCIVGSHVHASPKASAEILLAPKNDGIVKTGADLNGKTVAVNTVGNIIQLLASAWIKDDGGDPTSVNWVSINFPDMPAALQNGDIDAAFVVEPFVTASVKAGIPVLTERPSNAYGLGDANQSCWLATRSWIDSHKAEAKGFAAAITAGAEAANADPDFVRSILPAYTGSTQEVADSVILSIPDPKLTPEGLQVWKDAGLEFGLLTKDVDVNAIIANLG